MKQQHTDVRGQTFTADLGKYNSITGRCEAWGKAQEKNKHYRASMCFFGFYSSEGIAYYTDWTGKIFTEQHLEDRPYPFFFNGVDLNLPAGV